MDEVFYDVNKDGVKVAVFPFTKAAYRLDGTVQNAVELTSRARAVELLSSQPTSRHINRYLPPSRLLRVLEALQLVNQKAFTLNITALSVPNKVRSEKATSRGWVFKGSLWSQSSKRSVEHILLKKHPWPIPLLARLFLLLSFHCHPPQQIDITLPTFTTAQYSNNSYSACFGTCLSFYAPSVLAFVSFLFFFVTLVTQSAVVTIDIDTIPYPSKKSLGWIRAEIEATAGGVRVKELFRRWTRGMAAAVGGYWVWKKSELGSAETNQGKPEEMEFLSEQEHIIMSQVKKMVKSRIGGEVEGEEEEAEMDGWFDILRCYDGIKADRAGGIGFRAKAETTSEGGSWKENYGGERMKIRDDGEKKKE
ncbi:hypothetical protein K435DRAFT_797116 [Dendrothele bispora CBS 962.96]|uniref:Uncharacterized protein n=1 Tax=Dendrothele bispora (strain CBS 962.96) TaxID=1314807 RepID=A0A4S8M3J2_DENBC|nr:hypothetical protein K435DRAFT_797116 [Dendrothele bispora CBS 962.96]